MVRCSNRAVLTDDVMMYGASHLASVFVCVCGCVFATEQVGSNGNPSVFWGHAYIVSQPEYRSSF